MPIPLFGVLVIGMYGIVSGLVMVSLAAGVSYVPYVVYGALGKPVKLRPLRQLGVFAVAWLIGTALLTGLCLGTGDFSARDGHVTAFGIDIFSPWLLGSAAAAIPPVFIAGEVVLWVLRKRNPPPEA